MATNHTEKRNRAKAEPRYFIKSLQKGLSILETLAKAARPMSLQELSEIMGIGPTTMFRFLHTLEKTGFIEKDSTRKTYRLSPKVLSLGYAVFHSSDLWQIAHPYLVKASNKLNETMNMAILDGTDILYIDRVKTRKILQINLEIGSKLPAYCTSMGRVLLSGLSRDEAREILHNSKRDAFTENTLTDIESIEKVLDEVREKGYAINDGELAPELKSMAAPVRNESGRIVAAVNIAVHASQYDVSKMKQYLLPTLKETTRTISTALGYRE